MKMSENGWERDKRLLASKLNWIGLIFRKIRKLKLS